MGKLGEIQPIRAMLGKKDRTNTEKKEVPSMVKSGQCAGER
jgi:hypothetical protein